MTVLLNAKMKEVRCKFKVITCQNFGNQNTFAMAIINEILFNIFLASGNFFRLLITFANSLDPDQDRQNVGPDLDPNHMTL